MLDVQAYMHLVTAVLLLTSSIASTIYASDTVASAHTNIALQFTYRDGGSDRIKIGSNSNDDGDGDSSSNNNPIPLLTFDKTEYTPFEIVGITLYDRSRDTNPNAVDTASITVKGRNSIVVNLVETSESSGIFKGSLKLTPNPLIYKGDVEVRRDDWLIAVYNTVIATSARIVYHEAKLSFDMQYYYSTDKAEIRLEEPEANRDPYARDMVTVFVWSDTDTSGMRITLVESNMNTGIFTTVVNLNLGSNKHNSTQQSIRVTDNDRIVARYLDDTLPYPVRLGADNVTTVELRYVTAEAVFGTGIPARERFIVSKPEVITQFGEQIRVLSFGSKLAVKVELLNKQPLAQEFVCIAQVKYSDGTIATISMIASELESNTRAIVTLPWTPDKQDTYRIEVFVWDSIGKPVALAPMQML
ncbi:MAG: hypothetical protein QXN32_03290, partial [Candidatus Nitrosocaldus sp.]